MNGVHTRGTAENFRSPARCLSGAPVSISKGRRGAWGDKSGASKGRPRPSTDRAAMQEDLDATTNKPTDRVVERGIRGATGTSAVAAGPPRPEAGAETV